MIAEPEELDFGEGPGALPQEPEGWRQAWDQHPPPEGDPEYPEYRRLQPLMIEYFDQVHAAVPEPVPLHPATYFDGHRLVEPEAEWGGITEGGSSPSAHPTSPEQTDTAANWRTLADIDDAAPGPLILDMLEDGPNLAYAAPGVGKGCTGAFLGVEAQGAGMLPMVFDAERRPREWARRVSGLGGDRSRFVYVAPEDLGPKMAGRPLWEQIDPIRRICSEAGVDLLFVDSILPAVGVGEERLRSDAQAPFLYVAALDSLGMPSVSFGHPPKGQPEGEPFGSMAWVAAMRMTWLGSKAEGEGHRVRWRPRKRNERGFVAGILMTFSYGEDGRLSGVDREDDEESTREWLLAALVSGSRSVADLADELLEEEEAHVTDDMQTRAKERLSRTLRRMAKDGAVQREGPRTGPKVKWGLRWTA